MIMTVKKTSNLDDWTQTERKRLSCDAETLKENNSVKNLPTQRRCPQASAELTVVSRVVEGSLLVATPILLGSYGSVGGRAAACPHC